MLAHFRESRRMEAWEAQMRERDAQAAMLRARSK